MITSFIITRFDSCNKMSDFFTFLGWHIVLHKCYMIELSQDPNPALVTIHRKYWSVITKGLNYKIFSINKHEIYPTSADGFVDFQTTTSHRAYVNAPNVFGCSQFPARHHAATERVGVNVALWMMDDPRKTRVWIAIQWNLFLFTPNC